MAEKVLVLRTSDEDRRSHGGFQWPESGPVEAPDWDPTPKCGGGLHGALWGEGDGSLFDWYPHAVWQVVEVDAEIIVNLGKQVKFPRGIVVFSGDQKRATDYILFHPEGWGRAVIGAEISVGHKGVALVGYYGKATAGIEGTATAGDYGTVTVGDYGTATAGKYGKATAGHGGTATAGKYGTVSTGRKGTATAGHFGTAIVEHHGTATVGDYGTATVDTYGRASAGHEGIITIRWYDQKANRYRLSIGYIGEDGLEPNTLYKVDEDGNFVIAE